ncbi:non-ribosomal peptide synthetase [Bordetella genomosp. 10]|nr:non-ribosomal peptide synthetase [Bordetella genomosp. 10]
MHAIVPPAILQRALVEGDPPRADADDDEDIEASYPLSQAQRQLWLLQQRHPASTAYNLCRVVRLTGPLDAEALQAAFDAVLRRHAILRSRFVETADGVRQQPVAGARVLVAWEDLTGLTAFAQDETVQARVDLMAGHVFDLTKPAPLVARLLQLDDETSILMLCLHHIVSDGWSNALFFQDLVRAYQGAQGKGASACLPGLALQYGDFALRELEESASEAYADKRRYWAAYLGEDLPLLALGGDHDRPASAGTVVSTLSEGQAEAVAALAARLRCTPFVILMAAWQLLLGRLAGQTDFPVAVPYAGRDDEDAHATIGLFVTTQVYAAHLAPQQTFASLCAAVRRDAIAAMRHAGVAVDSIPGQEADGGSGLLRAMFDYTVQEGSREFAIGGLRGELLPVAALGAKTELLLSAINTSRTLQLRLEYDAGRFDDGRMQAVLRRYIHVLHQVTANPEVCLGEVTITPEADGRALVRNEMPLPHVAPSVLASIARHVGLRPDAVAVSMPDAAQAGARQQLTYGQLDAAANRVAHGLIARGVGVESRVGLAMGRGLDLIVGLLGILKAGAAYVALDPAYPHARLTQMVDDAGIEVVVSDTPTLAALPRAWPVQWLCVDALDARLPAHAPDVAIRPDNLAYVLYTSGSTGVPKGAQMTHGNVARLLAATQRWFNFGPDDVWTLFHSYAFDFSVWEIFGALCHGGRLVVVSAEQARAPASFLSLLRAEGVTVLNQTPSAFGQLIQVPGLHDGAVKQERTELFEGIAQDEGVARDEGGQLPALRLRWVIFGGEALDPRMLADWVAGQGPHGPRLVNMYGITETTVHVTYREIVGEDLRVAGSPVGEAIDDLGLYVLDATGQPVSYGESGELHVSGAGLTRGYLGRATLTAERFIPNPFADDGGRLYRTGDLARWSEDGELHYLGRIDQQVKIRGHRVEVGEVRARLLEQPGVGQAVVVARGVGADARLLAYVTPAITPSSALSATTRSSPPLAALPLDAAALRQALAQCLPAYMLPSAIEVLDQLPLTRNGKADIAALPEPSHAGRAYDPPIGEREIALAGVWQHVLGVTPIGRQDNFFELGGHSLMAITLMSALRRAGWKADVRMLFQHPELADFAAAVGAEANRAAEPDARPDAAIPADNAGLTKAQIDQLASGLPGGMEGLQAIHPLTPLQEGILFHHLMQEEGDVYVTAFLLAFDTVGRLHRFLAAFEQVIARHDILRTSVHWEGLSQPVQRVQRAASLPVTWLPALPDETPDGAAARIEQRTDPSHYRMDVREAPLLRGHAVHDIANHRWLLKLAHHHLALDHTSEDLLVRELTLLLADRPQDLAPPVSFTRFVGAMRGAERAGAEFFRAQLGDLTESTLPFNLADVQGNGLSVAEHRTVLDEELTRDLRAMAREHRSSAAALFHLAWALVLARISNREDVVFGTVLFGRMAGAEDAHQAVGMFINTLPLRVRMQGRDATAALRETQTALAGLIRHEHCSLALAQRSSGLPGGAPLFSAILNYRHVTAVAGVDAAAWEGIEALGSRERSNYPFAMSVNDSGTRFELVGHIEESVGAARIVGHMTAALTALVKALRTGDSRLVRALDLPLEDERSNVLTWGRGAASQAPGLPVHVQFEQVCRAAPHRVALSQGTVLLDYASLNVRANTLAHQLLGAGAGRGALIGLALDRGIDMLVAMLAVLKSGAAYLPLDPAYPADRLAAMIEESGMALLLTDASSQAQLPRPLPESLHCMRIDTPPGVGRPSTDPGIAVHPQQLAYVIYTSGSTGKPKGVMVSHGALTNFLQSMAMAPGLASSDHLLALTSLSFDISALELLLPLTVGARCTIATVDECHDGAAIANLLGQKSITVMQATPTTWRMLLDSGWQGGHLKALCGGEGLPADLAGRLRAVGVDLWNMYGPTETTIWSTTGLVGAEDPDLGHPIAATQVYVLDSQLEPAPWGAPGELYIGGAGVARGYLGRPGLTAERFLPDPYGANGGRLYRTGDLAAWTAAGRLQHLGRCDFQVKLRGHRIEPGEIEMVLRKQDGVRDAVVVTAPGPTGPRLVAYAAVDLVPGSAADGADARQGSALRRALAASLPEYMVPAAVVTLTALPLTPNGKIDRKALPAPTFAVQDPVAPSTVREAELTAIWAEVLGLATLGIDDDFFDLGGDSILTLQVIARLHGAGWHATPRQFFERRTIRRLAPVITAVAGRNEQKSLLPRSVAGSPDMYPPTPLQAGLLFESRAQPDSTAYVNQLCMDLDGLDVERFRRAWQDTVNHHEGLRASFFMQGDEVVQRIETTVSVPIDEMRVGVQPGQVAVAERALGFDLARAPLMRVKLVAMVDGSHHLIWTFHHLLMDGWSVSRFLGEVLLRYQGAHPPRTTDGIYRDYLAWMNSRPTEAAGAYWRERLAPLTVGTRLGEAWAASAPSGAVDQHTLLLDPSASQALRDYARREKVTLSIVMQGAWAMLLHHYCAAADVAFGATTSVRPAQLPGAQEMLGLAINTLPVTSTLDPAQPVGAWLRALQAQGVASREHDTLPLHEIQRLAPASVGSLFDTLVVFENYPVDQALREQASAGLSWRNIASHEETHYTVTLVASDSGQLRVRLLYSPTRIAADAVDGLLRRLRALLVALPMEGVRTLDDLDLRDTQDALQLAAWSSGGAAVAAGPALAERCRAQAARSASRVALAVGGLSMGYGELHARAQRLLGNLLALGVTSESRVAVAMDRRAELYIGLLAIHEAGAVCVPLDVNHPAGRLREMLSDCGAAVLLTCSSVRGSHPELFSSEEAGGARVIDVDDPALPALPPADVERVAQRVVRAEELNLMYVLYTSGSTGKPKGVAMPRGAFDDLLRWQDAVLPPVSSVLQFASPGFDVAYQEIFGAWTAGACLVVASEAERRDMELLAARIDTAGVERMHLPFAVLQALMETQAFHRVPCVALRQIVTAGESLIMTPALRQWLARHPDCRLYNQYGPTETHVVSHYEVPSSALEALPPIGAPINGAGLHVLDPWLRPMPPGVRGELYLSGPLARGYLGRAGQTADRFVPHAAGRPGARLYRTGDLARWRGDGALEYLGRSDHQLKIRGMRVEPAEIEASLLALPDVRVAAVKAVADGAGKQRLAAYVAPIPGARLGDGRALRIALRSRLPEHMVPATITVLDVLPLNANGKVDRAALPVPVLSADQAGGEPRGAMESALAGIWCEVLGIAAVGREDNFLDLGGHSLMAVRVQHRMRQRLGLDCPLSAILTSASLSALAGRLEAGEGTSQGSLDAVSVLEGLLDDVMADQLR